MFVCVSVYIDTSMCPLPAVLTTVEGIIMQTNDDLSQGQELRRVSHFSVLLLFEPLIYITVTNDPFSV